MTLLGLVSIVFTLAIFGLIVYLLFLAVAEIPWAPAQKIARIIIILFAILLLIQFLSGAAVPMFRIR